MNPMVMMLIGFVGGLMAMTIVNLYKWAIERFNKDIN